MKIQKQDLKVYQYSFLHLEMIFSVKKTNNAFKSSYLVIISKKKIDL